MTSKSLISFERCLYTACDMQRTSTCDNQRWVCRASLRHHYRLEHLNETSSKV